MRERRVQMMGHSFLSSDRCLGYGGAGRGGWKLKLEIGKKWGPRGRAKKEPRDHHPLLKNAAFP